jgi:hypothetical protein
MTSRSTDSGSMALGPKKKDIKMVTEGTLKMVKGSLQNFVVMKSD